MDSLIRALYRAAIALVIYALVLVVLAGGFYVIAEAVGVHVPPGMIVFGTLCAGVWAPFSAIGHSRSDPSATAVLEAIGANPMLGADSERDRIRAARDIWQLHLDGGMPEEEARAAIARLLPSMAPLEPKRSRRRS